MVRVGPDPVRNRAVVRALCTVARDLIDEDAIHAVPGVVPVDIGEDLSERAGGVPGVHVADDSNPAEPGCAHGRGERRDTTRPGP